MKRQLRNYLARKKSSFHRKSRQAAVNRLRNLEPLESRMMLHAGSMDVPHDHAPEHQLSDTIQSSLMIYVNGEQVALPDDVGVASGTALGFARTTDTDGTLEIGPTNSATPTDFVTLGDFFDIWRTNAGDATNNPDAIFSQDQLLDNSADASRSVHMFVNGVESFEFGDYEIHDNDRIVLSFTSQEIVTLHTNHGNILFQMLGTDAPGTVQNFLNYANDGDYDNSIMHRLVPSFVLQGGGFTTSSTTFTSTNDFTSVPTDPPIANEFGVSNTEATVAMAKLSGNANSATSQFFVNLGNNAGNLDNQNGGFTVFAQVLDMAIINDLASFSTRSEGGAFGDLPVDGSDQLQVVESVSGTAVVRGTVFNDANEDGVHDGNEAGIENTIVYQDLDNNGQLEDHEPRALTDADGNYVLQARSGADTVIRHIAAIGFQTVTPQNGSQTINLEIGGDTMDVDFGDILIDAPTSIDLVASTDTGAVDDDDITMLNNADNASTLEFNVSGVRDGAVVKLFAGNVEIGSAIATGTSVTITTNGASTLTDGDYDITATQIINSIESEPSAALMLTVDSMADGFTTSPPTADAPLATELTYDVGHDEEGNSGFTYSLINSPDGAIIDATTGVMTWTPVGNQLGTQSVTVQVMDLAGNTAEQDFDVNVTGSVIATYRPAITDLNDNPITNVQVGEQFKLNVFLQDLRAVPDGIFAGFMDVVFENGLLTPIGPIEYGPDYQNVKSGTLLSNGIDEVGAASGFSTLGGSEFLLFSVIVEADISGDEVISLNPADLSPDHDTLLFGIDDPTDERLINYQSTTLSIALGFGANGDQVNVDEDSQDNSLDVLANDTFLNGSSGTLTITGVGTPDAGGTVSINQANDRVIYTPAADFFGTETFTYTISDGSGTDEATVVVQVQPTNDPPTAINDEFTVEEDSTGNELLVLSNDDTAPDDTENLSVTAVGTGDQGGTIIIGPNGGHVVYSPAPNFVGTETFTYTVSDPGGLTSDGTVTVTVTDANDDPVAVTDEFTFQEDSSDHTLDVLQNDSTEDGETLTIVGLGAPSNGGIVTLAQDGLSVLYTPATDFTGLETVTYTISDGAGGSDTGTIELTIENINDPPTSVNDLRSVSKNSPAESLDVLTNDTTDPDPNETLTIESVTQGSDGGVVTIINNGSDVEYTPATDFVGTETFTYTVNDGNGETSTSTVTVNVLDFIPSSISGQVYLDTNNDGFRSHTELTLGGIEVNLIGTTVNGESVSKTALTTGDGRYEFTDLAPGNYNVVENQPAYLIDGLESRAYASTNDNIQIQLEQDSDLNDVDFAERGRMAPYISLMDVLFSTQGSSLLVANAPGQSWFAGTNEWQPVQSAEVVHPASDSLSLALGFNADGASELVVQTKSIQLANNRGYAVRNSGETPILYSLLGAPTDLGYNVNPTNQNGGSGEGEGEANNPPAAETLLAPGTPPNTQDAFDVEDAPEGEPTETSVALLSIDTTPAIVGLADISVSSFSTATPNPQNIADAPSFTTSNIGGADDESISFVDGDLGGDLTSGSDSVVDEADAWNESVDQLMGDYEQVAAANESAGADDEEEDLESVYAMLAEEEL